jgi:hypothetical protein
MAGKKAKAAGYGGSKGKNALIKKAFTGRQNFLICIIFVSRAIFSYEADIYPFLFT